MNLYLSSWLCSWCGKCDPEFVWMDVSCSKVCFWSMSPLELFLESIPLSTELFFNKGLWIPFCCSWASKLFIFILAMSNSCFTFHKWVSHIGSLQRCVFSNSLASKAAPRKVKDFPTLCRNSSKKWEGKNVICAIYVN